MSKFTCLVLCVVAASLSSVHVAGAEKPTLRDNLRPILDECSKEFPGISNEDIDKAAESGDSTNLNHCFNYCVFKKAGFINDKGDYDLKTGLTNLRKAVNDDEEYNKLVEVATQCTSVKDTVSDGEAGCEKGTMLSLCFLKNKSIVKSSYNFKKN